ncbi:amino acid adenylation domain-containing protein [Amycolatopsis japonica]|uniref:non-ribosomal peptide synthetase n=1 Tax=Amycolatopsis japonica TaxID=208439 RepID=UPI00366E3C81
MISDCGRLRLRAAQGVVCKADQEALKQRKSEILGFLDGRTACRLTGVQERLWFLDRLDPTGVAYTFTVAYRISGQVDRNAFSEALDAVVRKHPGLRATFEEVGGEPVQFINPEFPPVLRYVDLDGATSSEADERLRAELVMPFDLAKGPLLRSVLLRTAEGEHIWGVTLHHLIADGWTTGLIVDEVSRNLGACPGEDSGLDYTDYVEWERTRTNDPVAEANLGYWVDTLAGIDPLELPLDHPRPSRRGHRGARLDFTLPAGLAERLTEFGKAEAATKFGTLLAVHLVLLWHYTEHDDIAVGTPYANRPDHGFESTAGCFVSTLVLRGTLSPELTFRELVRRVSGICADAWDHQDYSYEKLVGELSGTRDLSRNPLFQNFFALQDVFRPLRVPGAVAEPHPFDTGTVQFDLELYFHPGEDGALLGSFHYDTELFDRRTIDAMAQRWELLCAALLASPDTEIGEFSLVSEQDRQAVEARNSTLFPYPNQRTVDDLIVQQVEDGPDRTALVCGTSRLAYAELDRAVAALALRIHAAGGQGRRVGILLDRGVEMVTAVLAAIRCGAVFVPLATDLPPERMAWIIEDTAMGSVVTTTTLADGLPEGIEPILVDRNPNIPPEGPLVPAETDDVAYVLHTSGSTGRPKGVEVRHGNLLNLIHAMGRSPGLGSDDVFLAVTSLSFDISLLEILLPLATGATLVIASQTDVAEPTRLTALLDDCEATVMQATPSGWRMLFDSGWQGRATLKALCGGEALSRDLADRLVAGCKEVWNLYGPTETTIWSARWQVAASGPVKIGEPIENTRFHIVNTRGKPVPAGIPGELCIAGAGVANGYLNQPEETGRRFVTLEPAPGSPEHVYRTGDLVRELPDGSLVFLGRADHQLKVRGHRVEAAEIEHTLRRHQAVNDAVVTLAPEGILVAHVLTSDAGPPVGQLRDLLGARLPAYMVPQRFVAHSEFPLTPNGKIDRKVLAARSVAETHTEVEPAEGATEIGIARIYEELLGRTNVGRHDDFFDLGGHSLLATKAVHRIEERFGVRLELQELFTDPSVAALAARVDDQRDRGEEDDSAINEALSRLESMSDEEAARLLAELGQPGPRRPVD